jgi:hypothetical protein
MPRSGSTLQYQIAVEVVRAAGLGDAAGWDWPSVSAYDAAPDTPIRVVKVHEPDPTHEPSLNPSGVVYLLTYRDTRDAAASFLAKFGERSPERLEAEVRRWLDNHRHFTTRHRVLASRYETFVDDIAGEVRRVAHVIEAPLSDATIESIASGLTPDRQRERVAAFEQSSGSAWDATTLLHRSHLADGAIGKWKSALTQEHLDAVLRASDAWLREMDYLGPCDRHSRGAA